MDVTEQLDRLAQDAPTGVPPTDLWRRGVRRRRRRLAAGAAASVLAVLLGGGVAGAIVAAAPTPTVSPADGGGAAIPDRIEQPDPWTPGTDRKGPPGRLAVVAGASRRTGILGASSDGLVGLSAGSGTYRFLDLPGRMPDDGGMLSADDPVALSPDGRRVAYWVGDTTASGVAIYDTVTGSVRRTSFASPLGLAPGTLTWVSSDRLLVRYAVITQLARDSMSSTSSPPWLLSASTGQRERLAARGCLSMDLPVAMPGGFSSWDGRKLRLCIRSGATYVARQISVRGMDPAPALGTSAVSPDRSRAALVAVPSAGPGRLYVASVPSGSSSTRARRVRTQVAVQTIVGWRDSTDVLVDGQIGRARGIYAVDVTTGTSEPVVGVPELNYTPGQVYATDLWSRPTVDRPAPPDVLNPQVAVAGGVVTALALLQVAIRVRRRRALA